MDVKRNTHTHTHIHTHTGLLVYTCITENVMSIHTTGVIDFLRLKFVRIANLLRKVTRSVLISSEVYKPGK